MRSAGAALAFVMLAACSSSISATDKAACKETGGKVETLFGVQTCIMEFDDGGTPCEGSEDCQGRCIVSYDGHGDRSPMCSRNNLYVGCLAFVEDGKIPDEYRCSP